MVGLLALPLAPNCAHATDFKLIYQFSSAYPQPVVADLIAKDGLLYGSTLIGGNSACDGDCGILFSLTDQGTETDVASLPSSKDTISPLPGLILLGGNFYVTGDRFIATYTAAGVQTRLLRPIWSNGFYFSAPVAYGTQLAVAAYGTKSSNPEPGPGLVFTVRKSGDDNARRILYKFTGGADGANPSAAPLNVNGTLYGVTNGGGANNAGVIYSIAPNGTETVLHSFATSEFGFYKYSLVYLSGKFYGVTGLYQDGSLYSIDTAGNYTVLHQFSSVDGAPQTCLTVKGGKLYGVTYSSLFSFDLNGTFTILHNLQQDGLDPLTALVPMGDSLYGAAFNGPASAIYKLTP